MPSASSYKPIDTPVKMLFIGDSSAGKTGALAALATAGYKLRILDFDNGIEAGALMGYLTDPTSPYVKQNPSVASNVIYTTCSDPMKMTAGRLIPAKAIAWERGINMLMNWKEGEDIALGSISTWTPQDVLVVDSLSNMATAALNQHLKLNAALGSIRTQNEARRDIGAAQNMLRDFFQLLFDDSIKCNVIVISHITGVTDKGGAPSPDGNDMTTGYPSAIGRALSPHIPRWFNSMLIAKIVGGGPNPKRVISTVPQVIGGQTVQAKSAAPLKTAKEYPLETGLADYFEAVRGKLGEKEAA